MGLTRRAAIGEILAPWRGWILFAEVALGAADTFVPRLFPDIATWWSKPMISPSGWALIVGVSFVFLVFEGAYRALRARDDRLAEYEDAPLAVINKLRSVEIDFGTARISLEVIFRKFANELLYGMSWTRLADDIVTTCLGSKYETGKHPRELASEVFDPLMLWNLIQQRPEQDTESYISKGAETLGGGATYGSRPVTVYKYYLSDLGKLVLDRLDASRP